MVEKEIHALNAWVRWPPFDQAQLRERDHGNRKRAHLLSKLERERGAHLLEKEERERERESCVRLFWEALGLEIGLLRRGLSPCSHGLGPLLWTLAHAHMHAWWHSILLFPLAHMPWLHVFMLAFMSIHILLHKSLALCTPRFQLETVPFFLLLSLWLTKPI